MAVSDGDTLTVLDAAKTQHNVRVHGIEVPEHKQACGTNAKASLAALAFQKGVNRDTSARLVGRVRSRRRSP